MKLRFFLVSDAAAISQDGKVIIHGVFDRITVVKQPSKEHPIVHPHAAVVYEVCGVDKTDVRVKIELRKADTNELLYLYPEVVFSVTEQAKIGGVLDGHIILPFLGEYDFVLVVDGTEVGRTSFNVVLKK